MTPGAPTPPVAVPILPLPAGALAAAGAVPAVPAGTMAAAGSGAAVALYDVDPDTVAALVLACPAVAGLSGGPSGTAATYLAGRRVLGVRISPDIVEVHVVSRLGPTIGELAGQVRAALAGRVLGRTVDIVVEDLADRPDIEPARGAPDLTRAVTAVVVTAGPADTSTELAAAGTPAGLATPVPVGASPTADQVVDPGEVLVSVEVRGTPPAPPDPPAVRPGRWTRPGRQG